MWNGTKTEIELTFIRHGFTRSNMEHRYLGRRDESLCEEGRDQLLSLVGQNKYPACDLLYSGPMKRCLETARCIYPHQEIRMINDWKEMDFGSFEGKTYEELSGSKDYQEWIDSNGTLPFPKGESREEFTRHTMKGWKMMLQDIGRSAGGKTVRVSAVVHGGTIMAILGQLEGNEIFNYQVKNTQGYLCLLSYDGRITEIKKLEKLE